MAIPISSSLTQINAEIFLQEGFELSLDAIIPSVELTGSFSPFESKTQFFIYNYAKEIVYKNLNWESANGSYLSSPIGTSISTSTSSYNQFEITPVEDVYNKGYSNGNFYAVYNFINYELGSERKIETINVAIPGVQEAEIIYKGHEYFIKDISGDRTELRIQNNYLTEEQIKSNYYTFQDKITSRLNADEFYVSIGNNRNFIGVNTQLELPQDGTSINTTSILIKLYKPLPTEIDLNTQIQIISKVGETQAFEVNFKADLQFVDNLLSLKGPNYNIDLKDRVNNSTNFKSLNDLVNTNSSQSYYQLNTLNDQKGVILRKNWADWNQFVKYSSAEARLNNFQTKLTQIESYEAEIANLSTINTPSQQTPDFSSSYNSISDNINQIITKFDSYEYFLYYITGSESWPKYDSSYPYPNYSVTSSEALNWFGSTNELDSYYNTGKNQIYSASRYDNNNQDYLYYLIPPFITDNSSNDQYKIFINMTGQSFDEMYLYTEAVEQVRNTNSGLTGSVLPLDLADEVITSLGFDTYANSFNSTGFDINTIGVFPATGSGLEYITRYIDIASGSVINYYDTQQSTLGYVISLADPSFPYPLNNSAQEIYKRIFHNMVSLVKRKGTVTGLRQLINIWGVPNTMLRISEFGGKNKNDENDYDLWMNRYSTALTTYDYPLPPFIPATTGAPASLELVFAGTDPGFDGTGVNLFTVQFTLWDELNSLAYTPKFSCVSDAADQDVEISTGVWAFYEGAGKLPAEKASNLSQVILSTNSPIKNLVTTTLDGVGGIEVTLVQTGSYNSNPSFGLGYSAFAYFSPLISSPQNVTWSGGVDGTLASSPTPSGSIRIPWQPLTGNYVDGNSPSSNYYSVPDCIQFRFKPQQPTSATANFSQSLLVKGNLYDEEADFAITLSYTGSQSGSFSGSVLPNNSQYGNLTFYLSGSLSDSGTMRTQPITLPFFDGNWWSVQLQRLTNISASNENATEQEWELRAANNIYDGYNGNQIGFSGKESINRASIYPSYNFAWNTTHDVTVLSPVNDSFAKGYSAIALGGMMQSPGARNQFMGTSQWSPTDQINIGDGFLGDFQEFRYYRRALSASQFNDYVMNPESIQGHADSNTGAGSSYDLLSFRLPLGNELEYTEVSGSATGHDWNNNQGGQVKFLSFGGNSFFAGENAFGSLHPSLVNKQGSLFTSSFITTNNVTTSQYGIAYQGRTGAYTSAITASYLRPNTEINYMDQPAAGIRNRIKNKIQVIDGNEYGTTLSPFRSIQQEFEQSSSYTEDLNSLEVGFSFQNEINDDIIATFGHGVVSDAIADPRFISESSDRYPELTRIAEDYFKKYQGVTVDDPTYNGGLPTIIEKEYDYNRLIKFYETSLFKAIKNYVPARTSLSTGIIVKQHLLERNKATTVIGINPNTPMAKTPETGSDSWGYTTQTGFNSVISNKNLLITSSIGVGSLTGSAGGSVNKYNIITNEGQYYQGDNSNVPSTSPNTFVNLFPDLNPSSGQTENNIFLNEDTNGEIYLESTVAFRSQMRFNPYLAVAPASPGVNFTIQITSSERGGIFTNTFPTQTNVNPPSLLSENYVDVYPNERLYVYVACDVLDTGGSNIIIDGFSFEIGEGNNFDKPEPKASQQVNWYRDNYTGLLKVKDTQEEFYNGEYSGSNIPVKLNEYNPYRIFADGNNLNPDEAFDNPSYTPPVLNLGAGPYNTTRFPVVDSISATAIPIRATASLVFPSGSKNGIVSSDSLLFWDNGFSGATSDKTIILSNATGTRHYVAIQYNSPLQTPTTYANANGKYLLSLVTNALSDYSTVTAVGPVPTNNGTETITLVSANKTIEASVSFGGGAWGNATVTNNNPLNDNDTNWATAGDNFTGFNSYGKQVNFQMTLTSINNGLLQVMFFSGTSDTQTATKFGNAVLSANGHAGTMIPYLTVIAPDNYVRLTNATLGVGGNTAITYLNNFTSNTGAGNGIVEASRSTGASPQYLAPTIFQGGTNEPSSTTIYLQNSITNLFPGVTYNISFDVTNYATDGLGSSNFDIGLSTLDSPGGTNNGIGQIMYPNADASRTTQDAAISRSWQQAVGTSTAMFFSSPGVFANISNVNISIPPSILGPKHFYERDSFTIVPTSSFLFQNSPYNPIINNVSGSRKNSFLLDQDFNPVSPGFKLTEGIPNDYTLLISASQLGWEGVATANNLLEFSEVPDSNYTTTAIINPRYKGSKVTSADYNFRISEFNLSESAAPNTIISPLRLPGLQKESKIKFLNGETGSWKGDSTNEYQSAIETRPIYFAHFKSSYENYELYNSTTFDIDQLIQVPFNSIQSEQAPIITSSQLNGNNENLVAVGSTFIPNRKLKPFYNQSTKQFRNLKKHLSPSDYIIISPTLDYTIADNNSNYILFPAQEVLSYYTNEKTQQEVVVTHSFNAPIWVKDSINYNPTIGAGKPIWQITSTSNNSPLNASSTPLTQSIQPLPLNSATSSTTLLVTGSSPNGDLNGYGLLYLQGMATNGDDLYQWNFGASTPAIQSRDLNAPHLQLINTINHNIDIGDISYSTSQNPYLFPDGTINTQVTNSCAQWTPVEDDLFGTWPFTVSTFVNEPLDPTSNPGGREGGGLPSFPTNPLKTTAQKGIQNYFTYNYSMSVLTEYTEETLPIMIERGDEIRVSYSFPLLTKAVSNTSKTNEIVTQTFKVLGYEQAPPSLLFGKPLTYNGTSQLGWGSNEAMVATFGVGSNEFEAIASNLPPTGLFSPDSLKEKFDLLATNQQNVIGVGLNTNDDYDNAFTGSIISCKVESRWGEISGSSTTVAPTGSIRVRFRGYQGGNGSDANKPNRVMSIQQILRTTMGGVSGSYAEADSEEPITSKFAYCLTDGSDYNPLDAGFMFDTLKVSPNPATLAKPIPNGSIMSATFKKRIDNDTKVVVNVTQPPGNEGALTPSGDGYLIPDDLTSTQMDNVQKIINVLKSQNSFTNPPDANETTDVS